ncbi:MAG: PAS domain-containing protein, partial [Bacteroidota bacterium]
MSDEKVLHWVRRCFGSGVEKRLIHASISNQSEHFQVVVPVLGYRCRMQCLALDKGLLLSILSDAEAERAELGIQPVLDALPMPAIVVDVNRQVLFSNNQAVHQQFVQHTGAGAEKREQPCKALVSALDQHTLAQPTRTRLTWRKREYAIETQPIVDADLQLRFVLIRCKPQPTADWASFQSTALPRLIREQLLHQFSGCYAAFKRSGELLEVNDNCREMLAHVKLTTHMDALELQEDDWQELEEAGSMSSELRLGMQVYSIELFLVRNPELEDVLLLIGVNISDRVLIERETQAYLALFRELFNAAEDGLAVLNGDDMVVREGNARFAELSGLPLGKLPGQSLDSCKHLDTGLLREQIAIARELGNKTLELNAGPEQLTHNLSVTYFESARCFLVRLSDLSAQLLQASQQREQ